VPSDAGRGIRIRCYPLRSRRMGSGFCQVLSLFRIGNGEFELAQLTDRLMLVPDRDDHGTVQPAAVLPYQEFKQAIYDTRDQWVSGEEEDDR
jgi:hypothetical protein